MQLQLQLQLHDPQPFVDVLAGELAEGVRDDFGVFGRWLWGQYRFPVCYMQIKCKQADRQKRTKTYRMIIEILLLFIFGLIALIHGNQFKHQSDCQSDS